MKKRCNKCNKRKKLNKFYKKLNGTQPSCKKCQLQERIDFQRTLKGSASILFTSHRKRNRRKGFGEPNYSRKEFLEWLFKQKLFHNLYLNWVNSNYEHSKAPSVDRIHDNLPYEISNIQLMTWGENKEKGHDSFRKGLISNSKPHISVNKLTLCGEFIKTYISMMEAKRDTGVAPKEIHNVISGKAKQAGGFKWQIK